MKTVASVALMLAAGVASAGVEESFFRISAFDQGSGTLSTFVVEYHDGEFNEDTNSWSWQWDGGTNNFAGGADASLGGFTDASIEVNLDARGAIKTVNLGFDVFSGAGLTAFSITSGVNAFPSFASPLGVASASVGVTDILGDGATLSPDGAGIYKAIANGSTFADLLTSPLSVPADSSLQFDDAFGFAPVGFPVDEISSEWNFTLTALDSAAGTSTFSIIPAPGSAAVLGLAGLVATRRRRA